MFYCWANLVVHLLLPTKELHGWSYATPSVIPETFYDVCYPERQHRHLQRANVQRRDLQTHPSRALPR